MTDARGLITIRPIAPYVPELGFRRPTTYLTARWVRSGSVFAFRKVSSSDIAGISAAVAAIYDEADGLLASVEGVHGDGI